MIKRNRHKRSKSQEIHTRWKGVVRYGLNLGGKSYDSLCSKVAGAGPEVVLLFRESRRLNHFAVWWEGVWLPVVFDLSRKTVVTVLPPDALRGHETELPDLGTA